MAQSKCNTNYIAIDWSLFFMVDIKLPPNNLLGGFLLLLMSFLTFN